jgi:hypothetical protein
VAQTGQVLSYGERDDGELQTGVEWPAPRFRDNLDGTVTDRLTGLVWLQTSSCLGRLAWEGALSAANALADGQCGLSDGSAEQDWRLPNLRELLSLIDFGEFQPAVPDGHLFHGVKAENHWSSTTRASDSGDAWHVDFYNGKHFPIGKANKAVVWPVREAVGGAQDSAAALAAELLRLLTPHQARAFAAGASPSSLILPTGQTLSELLEPATGAAGAGPQLAPSIPQAIVLARVARTGQIESYGEGDDGALRKGVKWPVPRFQDNLDGTVTDKLTDLVWLRDASCLGKKDWDGALEVANLLDDGQCGLSDGSEVNDWRLPNLRELVSLVDYGRGSPALPADHPFIGVEFSLQGVLNEAYWSSTTRSDMTTAALPVFFLNGSTSTVISKLNSLFVWPVRGGHHGGTNRTPRRRPCRASGPGRPPAGGCCPTPCRRGRTGPSRTGAGATTDPVRGSPGSTARRRCRP